MSMCYIRFKLSRYFLLKTNVTNRFWLKIIHMFEFGEHAKNLFVYVIATWDSPRHTILKPYWL